MFSSKPKTIYALTNNRALILEEKDGVCKILQQFPIDKATVSVLNRRQANAGFARDPRFDMGSGSDYKSNWQRTKDAYKEIYLHPFKTRAPVVIYKTAGDVVFFIQGKMILKVTEVIEPDAVVDMAHKIFLQEQDVGAKYMLPVARILGPDEQEIWREGQLQFSTNGLR